MEKRGDQVWMKTLIIALVTATTVVMGFVIISLKTVTHAQLIAHLVLENVARVYGIGELIDVVKIATVVPATV
jgi:hypothetical protein